MVTLQWFFVYIVMLYWLPCDGVLVTLQLCFVYIVMVYVG